MIISLFLLTYIVNAFILSLMVIQCCHLGPTSQSSNKTYCISVIQLTNCSFLVKVWWTEKINNRILQICWCFSNKSISYSSRHSHCGGIGFTWKLYFIIVYFLIEHIYLLNQRLSHISISFTGNLSFDLYSANIEFNNWIQHEHIFKLCELKH